MKTSKKIFWILLVIILVGGGIYYFSRGDKKDPLATETVRRDTIVETVSVTGEYVPVEYGDLTFGSAGVVDTVFVTEGERVKKGDVLASLDRTVLNSQRAAAQLALQIAIENEKLARRGWDKLKPEEREAKKLATEAARGDIRTLSAQIENSVLRAPFDGTISRVSIRKGEGVTLASPVMRLVEGNEMEIEARIPESDIAKVELGMQANVTFDAFTEDEKFTARVKRIEPAATVIQDVVSYVVEFLLEKPDNRLREGMTANIDIETRKRENVLVVPFRALSKEGGKNYAQLVRSDGQLVRKEVMIGLEGDDGTVEILSGLAENDVVTIGAKQAK